MISAQRLLVLVIVLAHIATAEEWTHFPYHGPVVVSATWDKATQSLLLQKDGTDAVAGLVNSSPRRATDSVSLTIGKVTAPGKPWAQVGLMIASKAQPGLLDSRPKYEWLVRRETNGSGWDYRVRKDVGSGSYELYASSAVDPVATVNLEILRQGDNYEFRANGVLHYRTGKNPADTYSVQTKDSMLHYGITFGGSGPMTAEVKDFGHTTPTIVVQPARRKEPQTLTQEALGTDFETIVYAKPPQVSSPCGLAASASGDVYVSVDLNSVFNFEPNRGRIVKCRDTDGDGAADVFTDFVPDIDAPRGSCFVGDTLYVVHPPFLTAFRDTDNDGVADERNLLIKNLGFYGKLFGSTGHTSNGVRMGIDGWLYLAIGDFGMVDAIAKDGSTMYLQGGGVLRVRPDGTELELVTANIRNIMDAAVSPRLDLFARDNNNDGGGWGVRFHHLPMLADMGYPRLYKNFPSEQMQPLADNRVGSGTGAAFIDEPGIPDALNNTVYTCDFSTRHVYVHLMEDAEATFTSKQQVFYEKNRVPIDIDIDGSSQIYVCDWNGGNFGYNGTNVGRVTLIRPQALQQAAFPDLLKASDKELLAHVSSQSAVLRTNAQHEILKRGPKTIFRDGLVKAAADEAAKLHGRIAALFTFKQLLGIQANATLLELAGSDAMREFALRALADRKGELAGVTTAPFLKGLRDSNPRVRLQSVIALSRLGDTSAAPHILPLGVPQKVDHNQAIPHVAAKAVVSLNAVDACLKVLADTLIRPVALRCLQEMHDPRAVDGLMAAFRTTEDADLKAGIMTALFRLYHKEKRWEPKGAKDWWHTRPDDRGPYFAPITWEQSPKIKAFIESNWNAFDQPRQVGLLKELTRNRLDPKALTLSSGKAAHGTLALLERTEKNISAIVGIAKSKGKLGVRVEAFDALAKIPSAAVTKAQLDVLDYWGKNHASEPLLLQKKMEFLYSTQHVRRIAELDRLSAELPPSQQAMIWTIIVNLHNSPLVG
ncbi:MAG: hypothetical protein ACI8W8_003422, partial [Rhodothermales bacterium]